MIDLDLPDLSDHPAPQQVDLATFERWVIEIFIPQAIARGDLTQDSPTTTFSEAEGMMREFK